MDHWGDPWADHATDKSPTKKAVASPQPPAFTFAPGPINGFVDDAGWGDTVDEEDGFGDWAAGDMGNGAASFGGLGTRVEETAGDWPEIVSPMPRVLDKVDSETSDSSTVAQLEEAASQIGAEDEGDDVDNDDDEDDDISDIDAENVTPTPQPELESVRSSTSPSETSRNELPVESPRTSIEDDRTGRKDEEPHQEAIAAPAELNVNVLDAGFDVQLAEEDTASNDTDLTGDRGEPAASMVDTPQHSSRQSSVDSGETGEDGEPDSTVSDALKKTIDPPDVSSADAICDMTLMAQLFPSSRESDMQLEEHTDPIFSTSARKAWYRLTRKQTMREYNHGENDDNYVRVTWTNSNVRTEVNKVVSRWAREDRISGTGPGARASFYWDSPAPPEAKAPFNHLRTQSSAPATKTALPARQSLPPLATSQSAAFDWSSPASADPWKIESPAQRSSSSPLALKNPTVAKLQRQEGRAVSVDLTPRKSEQTAHKRTATTSHLAPETKLVPNLISPPITQPSAEASDPWTNLNSFDAPSTSAVGVAEAPADDDDDWGEMVQTPTLPTPQQLDPFPQPAETRDTLPSPLLPPSSSPVVTPVQAEQPEPMFASPIVRLQSTISPTSALFKANAFIPLHAEQGPIGPGLLKPANRGLRSTSGKKLEIDTSGSSKPDSAPAATVAMKASENGSSEILSFLDASDPMPSPPGFDDVTVAPLQAASLTPIEQPNTPVQAPADSVQAPADSVQAPVESWADADFSFFESAPPVITVTQQPPQLQNASDPFSFFDAPAPATYNPSKPTSRSPPRTTPPPALQPLTNATSSLHQRKVEEDQLISDILSRLPDLSYMLR